MTGGLGPEELGETTARAAAAGMMVALLLAAGLLAIWALVEGWRIESRRRAGKARERAAWAALAAAQLEAGTHAGWHDASPGDRRRDR